MHGWYVLVQNHDTGEQRLVHMDNQKPLQAVATLLRRSSFRNESDETFTIKVQRELPEEW